MSKKVLIACAGLILVAAGAVQAGVPCAGTSTVIASGNGPCAPGAAICPYGDLDTVTATVTVRDCYGTPLPGLMVKVWAIPSGAPFCYCLDGEPPPDEYEDTKIVGPTGPTGVVTAQFRNYGGCGNQEFYATVSSVVLGPSPVIYIASPDWTGDCVVNLVDFGYFAMCYLTMDPCCDYDCNGIGNLIDFGLFAVHYLHACP